MEASGRTRFVVLFIWILILCARVKPHCSEDCDALASYYIWNGSNLWFISSYFSTTISDILSYNPQITDPNYIYIGSRLNVPFSCGCIGNEFMAHQFPYQYRPGNDYQLIAQLYYSNLTTEDMMRNFNSYPPGNIPDNAKLNVTVNCSCGNGEVSADYGLFVTYPLRPGQSLDGIANQIDLPQSLLQDYNPGVDFSSGSGLVFVPGRDQNGTFPPLSPSGQNSPPNQKPSRSSGGLSGGEIAGISIGAAVLVAVILVCLYISINRQRNVTEPPSASQRIDSSQDDSELLQTIGDGSGGF